MGILYDRSLELLNAVLYAMLQVILVTSAVFAVFASERINTTQSQVSLVRPERVSLFHKLEIVRTLDINSFKSMLNDTHTVWLVNFYSPWCPHCLQFATEWEDVAKIYAKVESIQLGAVDCTTQNEICDREGVYSYPGIKMYHVPPKSKAAIDMSHDDNVYARHVAKWIEETLKENGMGPIINVGGINSSTSKHRGLIKLYKFGDPVEPLYNEKAMDTRIKRLKDAGSTVLLTLEDGFFMGTTMLTGERYEAAVTWVQTLAIAFPLKENRAAFALLLDLIRQQQTWSQKDWNAVLYKWKDSANAISYPTNLFASKENLSLCTTFTCGLWTLFHSLTVNADQLQPSKVLKAIRLVVEHFFGCEECRRHFLKASPDIIVKTLALADDDGSHVVTIWLWLMHNRVNRVLGKPRWPTNVSCPNCFFTTDQPLSLNLAQLNLEDIATYTRNVYRFDDQLKDIQLHQNITIMLWTNPLMIAGALLIAFVITTLLLQKYLRIKPKKTRDHMA